MRSDTSSSQSHRASVIVVNYNGGEKLIGCLASVVPSLPGDCELIVVDNASTDRSADEAATRFPGLVILRSPTNVGFGAGCNLGVRGSTGRYLAFLNPDTTVEPGWLEALVDTLESEPDVGLVTSMILQADDRDRISACGNRIHISGLALGHKMGRRREEFPLPEVVDAVSGAAFAMRRDLFDQLGGFDEDFFLYLEDTDLSWRARLAGKRCLCQPASVVYHDYTFRLGPRKIFYQERNRYVMLLKCLRRGTLIVLVPVFLLAEILTWGFALLRDRPRPRNKIDAYAWVVRNRRGIRDKRREVQSRRLASDRSVLRTAGHRLDYGQVAGGMIATFARLVFDPLFFVLRAIAVTLVRW